MYDEEWRPHTRRCSRTYGLVNRFDVPGNFVRHAGDDAGQRDGGDLVVEGDGAHREGSRSGRNLLAAIGRANPRSGQVVDLFLAAARRHDAIHHAAEVLRSSEGAPRQQHGEHREQRNEGNSQPLHDLRARYITAQRLRPHAASLA